LGVKKVASRLRGPGAGAEKAKRRARERAARGRRRATVGRFWEYQ